MNWHSLKLVEIMKQIGTQPEGLSTEGAAILLEKNGLNELIEKKKKPVWQLFLKQFRDFMILVLIAAAIITGFVGDVVDTIIILVIVLLNAIVGFIQEYRAEKAMMALKKLAAPHSTVLRDGKTTDILSSQLVPGDIVILEAGTLVPADIRLIETHALNVEESSLTGESVAVDKTSNVLKEEDLPLGDRINMAYKGTLIKNGRGRGVVVATGMNTELGRIAQLLQQEETITPLQKRMADFGKKLSYLILVICIILFGVGKLRGEKTMPMLLVAISLAVAAIPEALPALITIALARGAKRLVKKNVLIRKLPAVETLGSVTFICSDKTGTLTQNKMEVKKVISDAEELSLHDKISILDVAILLNQDTKKDPADNWIGDPTEIALIEYVDNKYSHTDIKEVLHRFDRVAELPFDPDRKRMTTIHHYEDKYIAFSKGAAESIITLLENDKENKKILKETSELAQEGMRVLGYGYRVLEKISKPLAHEEIEKNLHFIGLVGMIDPPRKEAKEAIHECRTAGIQPIMITGDHRETATSIAKEIGILNPGDITISGTELKNLTREQLDQQVEKTKVYARVSPEQKLNIVTSLQRKRHFVAMTGDGVNDAPSLKKADIGIAMGITGTDVSKESSDMILLDDNFATIVRAIKEGRRIYDNIRKFVKYIMTCNSAEVWTIFLAPLIGLPVPLLPVHILWINLVTDGLPGLALGSEKAEKNIMQRPPRKTDESLFAEGTGYHIIWVGLLMAFVTLGIQAWAIHIENGKWQTMVFTVLSLAQLGHVLAIRSDNEFIYKLGIFTNPQLFISIIITFCLQLGIIYLPFANEIFKTQPLSFTELLISVGASAIVFHAVELEKWVKRKIKSKKL